MGPWREEIIKIAKKIRWIPSYGLDLEIDWLRNMRDWMISKKRYWGLALPIWECKECSFFEVIGSREELQKKATQGWEDFAGHSPHRPWVDMVKIRCEKCGKEISRIPDVGNPWLDAGIVPYSTTRYYTDREYWQKWIPADLVLECFPGQFRNWFYSLLAMSTMMENIPPFKTLLGHALVRDEKGEEMHKSKGNAIQIDEAIEKMGADVIRWLFCNHEVTTNLNFGYTPAREIRGKFFNTLWNTYSFFVNYARLIDFKPNEEELIERSDLDKWILSELQLLIKKARENFENLNVRGVCQASEVFLENLSNWYIRHSRRRFWRSELDKDTRAAYATLYQCLETLIRILAPIIPFVTEEIYQGLVRSTQKDAPESVHLTEFPRLNEQYLQPELSQEMRTLIRLTHLGLSAREKGKRKVRQPLSELIISPRDESEEKVVKKFERMLKESLNVKKVTLYPPKTPLPKDAPNLAIADEEETSVAVEITLNEELLIEGLMRDFLRRAQRLRKEIGLEIEDRIKVSYTTPSPKLKLMLERFREFILHELLCLELQEKAALTKAHLIKIGNEEIFLEIEKVNYWRKDNVDKN
jgi:isoleucyl-tRNA synthetase